MGEECCLFVCVEQSVWVVVRVEGEVVNWFGILGKGVRKRTLAREMNNSAAAVVSSVPNRDKMSKGVIV